jgi:hypothetical protein
MMKKRLFWLLAMGALVAVAAIVAVMRFTMSIVPFMVGTVVFFLLAVGVLVLALTRKKPKVYIRLFAGCVVLFCLSI